MFVMTVRVFGRFVITVSAVTTMTVKQMHTDAQQQDNEKERIAAKPAHGRSP
jgi:hypothetical protein